MEQVSGHERDEYSIEEWSKRHLRMLKEGAAAIEGQENYLQWDGRRYRTSQTERLGEIDQRPEFDDEKEEGLYNAQVAYLLWEYHALCAEYYDACAPEEVEEEVEEEVGHDGYDRVAEAAEVERMQACGIDPDPIQAQLGEDKTDASALSAEHARKAREWAVLYIALQSRAVIDEAIALRSVRRVIGALSILGYYPELQVQPGLLNWVAQDTMTGEGQAWLESQLGVKQDDEGMLRHASQPRIKRKIISAQRPSLLVTAMGCVLAAAVCGACMYAMPLLLPSVLSAANHWVMVSAAAAGGALVMGYDTRMRSKQFSGMRALCLTLALGAFAVTAYALSHVALPLLAATQVLGWSASITTAVGAGLTLFTMLGVGGLTSHALPLSRDNSGSAGRQRGRRRALSLADGPGKQSRRERHSSGMRRSLGDLRDGDERADRPCSRPFSLQGRGDTTSD